MSRNTEQKVKLLVLYDILCRLTDENHALNSDELIDELAKYNITASRKVLPLDIALLNEYGYSNRTRAKRRIIWKTEQSPKEIRKFNEYENGGRNQ